jgi:hypothetical protein
MASVFVIAPGVVHAGGDPVDVVIKIDRGDSSEHFNSLSIRFSGYGSVAPVPVKVDGKGVATLTTDPATGVMDEHLTVLVTRQGADSIACGGSIDLSVTVDEKKLAVMLEEGSDPIPERFADTVLAVFVTDVADAGKDDTAIGCNARDVLDAKSVGDAIEVWINGERYWLPEPTVYPLNPNDR